MAMTQTQQAVLAPPSPWPKTLLRIAFGAVWLVDAGLKWTTHFRSGYIDHLTEGSDGRPGWLDGWFRFWVDLQSPHPYFWAYLVAVTETGIALAVIVGFARKLTYSAALVFSLLIWATAEGFGGPYTGASADVDAGAGIIYALVFAALLAFAYYLGTSRYSVDYYLEQRISWWHWVAEVGRRNHPHGTVPAAGGVEPDAAARLLQQDRVTTTKGR